MCHRLIKGLDWRHFETHAGFLSRPGPFAERLRKEGIPVHILGQGVASAPFSLTRLIRNLHFDIVHAYGFKASSLARFICGRKTRVICGVRGLYTNDRESDFLQWMDRFFSGGVNTYLIISRAVMETLIAQGFPAEKCRFIPNGLPPSAFAIQRKEDSGSRPPRIICVANLRPVKDHSLLLRALERLRRDNLDFVAWFVGDGPLRSSLEEEAIQRGLGETVQFMGFQDQVSNLLAQADIFVLTSFSEGTPVAILEAMAAGLPIVATDVGGVRDLVLEGETGFLVPHGDESHLAACLRNLIENPEERRIIGKKGKERALVEFSEEAMISATAELYEEIVRSI